MLSTPVLLPTFLVLVVITWALSTPFVAAFSCDGSCSGHGACDPATGRCTCFPRYLGPTCASMACPHGTAWVDYAHATDSAHASAECSNMGLCDRATGFCRCAAGFTGVACERMACPTCVNGRCISMRDAAALNDGVMFRHSATYTRWDADKIYGCQCDHGFTGWDCSRRACPIGDDPLTPTTPSPGDEVQQLNCLCNDDGVTCTGTFALTFQRRTTRNLLPSETAATLTEALLALDTVHGVSVTVSTAGGTGPICDADGVTTSITFTHDPGDLPALQVQSRLTTASSAISITTSGDTGLYDSPGATMDGTRDAQICSNRGLCDTSTGICSCLAGFSSSDGAGAPGVRGDCGYGSASACATTANGVCDLHGLCSGSPTWVCQCFTGFIGADCSKRSCPQGTAWFDGATSDDTAHALAECSNKGTCDRATGLCVCHALFTGSACELLNCPQMSDPLTGTTTTCSGHGTCLTMQQLAVLATDTHGDALGVTYGDTLNDVATWDAHKIQGCHCADAFYMGAYSSALGAFHAYDCSVRACPRGADPYETGTVNEKQALHCQASAGSFTLTFRQQTIPSPGLAWDASASDVQAALQALRSITQVTVTMDGAFTTVCDASAVVTTTIEFVWQQGDLPLLTADTTALTMTSFSIEETQAGTKANVECSARGVCDRSLGVCQCFDYFLSSDGDGNVGVRGDCGYISSYPTLSIA